jgi:hypothetical protein
MDYTDGTHIAKWQWDLIHDPGVILRVFEKDEDAMKIVLSDFFDKEDLAKYNILVSNLKTIELFNFIYQQLDVSNQYFRIESLKVNHTNYVEILKKYENTNGYFLDAKKPNGGLFGFFMNLPGEKDNPHMIVLFSSKNYTITNKDGKQLFKGDGFNSSSTIFEEFFHAAHYLYLVDHNKYVEESFTTQTETEVEIAKALAYYIMKSDKKYENIVDRKFDGYNFIRKTGLDEIDNEKAKFFKQIIDEKNLSDTTINQYVKQIETLIEAKNKTYKNMNINKLDKNFDFIKYLINNGCK